MDIYAVQGSANAGKTTTLISLFITLNAKYPSASVTVFHKNEDIKVLLTGINGMTIGIESQGDPNSRLQKSLADFQDAGCDIIFCACRTRGMTVDWINALSPPFSVHFIQKARVTTNQAASNSALAATLMQSAGL